MIMWLRTVGYIVTLILSVLALPLAAEAQQLTKVPRIGVLSVSPSAVEASLYHLEAFRQGLRDLGYKGGTIVVPVSLFKVESWHS
jgi:hypothetical protein